MENKVIEQQYKLAEKKIPELLANYSNAGVSEYLIAKQCEKPVPGIYYGTGCVEVVKDQDDNVIGYIHHPGSNKFIVIPAHDQIRGVITTLQYIYDKGYISFVNSYGETIQKSFKQGHKWYLAGGKKEGSCFIIGDPASKIKCISEGYTTGLSIYLAIGFTIVMAFDAGNIEPVVAKLIELYPAEEIIICADDDRWKDNNKNTGKETAEATAMKYGCRIATPVFEEKSLIGKPTDFNDLYCLEGAEAVKSIILKSYQDHPKQKLPANFELKKDGLYHNRQWVCDPIEVIAYTHDENNQNWGRVVRFNDPNHNIHELAIPMELLSGDYSTLNSMLLSSGLRMGSRTVRSKIAEFIQLIDVQERSICVARIGWHSRCFVRPDGNIPTRYDITLQSDSNNYLGFCSKGTLEEWQEKVALQLIGDTRLIFSMACAFAAPLIPLFGAEGGGFNLTGSSSIGKTTALNVASSICGNPATYILSWRSTSNAVEAVAESRNHSLLTLDELGVIDGKDAGEVAYMLAAGSGKNRLKPKSGLRKRYEWSLLILSTGEITIADKMNESGKKVHAGIMNRMVDIPADAGNGCGIFDHVLLFKDGNAKANYLKDVTSKYYGTAIRAFLSYIVNVKENLHDGLKAIESEFFNKYVPEDADGQVKRVAQRFVLVAAGGELAIEAGILPYKPGNVLDSVGSCFQDWLEERGGSNAYEIDEGIRQVRSFFEAHHSSRFSEMKPKTAAGSHSGVDEKQKIINQAGYRLQTEDERFEFFVFREVFRKEICKGFNPKLILEELVKTKLLLCEKGNVVKWQRLPIGPKKIYHFSPSILAENDNLGDEQ